MERLYIAPNLYYLHRIGPSKWTNMADYTTAGDLSRISAECPPEDSIPTINDIRKAGKTRYIDQSESSAKLPGNPIRVGLIA